MADFSLEERFPEMKPISSPPALWTVNGIGLAAYGSRDYDPFTHTYVKTHCLCVFFLPILTLGAYRVADAPEGGWYFLGKVPLSRLAHFWNFLVLGLIVGGVGLGVWIRHTSSAEYRARQNLAEGARLADAKQIGRAARLRDHPAFARAVQQYERLLILAPRDLLAPASLAMLYATSQDKVGLRRLAEHTRKAELDLERTNRETLEMYQGKKEPKQRIEHKARVARRRKALEDARKVGGATRAAAAAELALELSRADGLGLPLDAGELVRLAGDP